MISGFGGIITGVALGGAAIQQIGNAAGSLGSGIASASQSLVAGGVLGNTAGKVKNMFKWK